MAVTLYWIVQADATATPTGAQIVAGQDGTGAAALASGSEEYTAAGDYSEAIAITGLTAGTPYEQAWVAYDGSTYSSVVTATITTASAGVEYTQAWTVYDDVLTEYSTPVVGTVTTTAAGQHETGGSSASVTVLAVGAGTAVELGSGGADAVVGAIATGSGAALEVAADGATSAIQITATGSGTALEAVLGGSSAQITVTATGAGFKEASSLPVLSLGTFVPGSILSTGLRGRVTATAYI